MFIIATDTINRYLDYILVGVGTLRAYADDNALILKNIFEAIPMLHQAFQKIGGATNLWLNGKKCVIIPLRRSGDRKIKDSIVFKESGWSDFLVEFKGKYLGYWIGPEARESGWTPIIMRFNSLSNHIASLGLPMLHRIMLYNMLAVSLFPFQGILRRVPDRVWAAEKKNLLKTIHGPGDAYPIDYIFNWKSLNLFPIAPRSIFVATRSAAGKMSILNSYADECRSHTERAR